MPYDPTMPQPGDDLAATPLRNQFNALKSLVDDQAAKLRAWLPARNHYLAGTHPKALGVHQKEWAAGQEGQAQHQC